MDIKPTIDQIIDTWHSKGWRILADRPNIFGIRSTVDNQDKFVDWLGSLTKIGTDWQLNIGKGTTVPGDYWLQHPMNSSGTAIVASGMQHLEVFMLGLHKGISNAFVQVGTFKGYRDNNKDLILNLGNLIDLPPSCSIERHRSLPGGRLAKSISIFRLPAKWIGIPGTLSTILNLRKGRKPKRGNI